MAARQASQVPQKSSSSCSILKKYNTCVGPTLICTDDILCQIYPNQNMCVLLQEIPKELLNLPYVIYPNCVNYNLERFISNKRFNIFPHAIIKPNCESELIYALKILRKYNLEFSLRSGGHCYEPGSLTMGYVIDLSNFNTVQIINNGGSTPEVFIGAGARLGGVIEKLAKFNYAIPTGTCGSNGIAGLTLGGGVGFLARKFGLTCDVLKSITFVNANLDIITVDDNNFSDLFWALRGAGNGSYGIAIGFTFKLFYVPTVSLLQLDWEWDSANVPAIFNAWQNWVATLSDDITAEIDLDYVNGQRHVSVFAIKVGNTLLTEWQPFFSGLNPQVTVDRVMSYLESAEIVGGDSTLPFLKSKSKMLFTPLSNAGIAVMVNFFDTMFIQNKQFSVHLEFDSAGGESARHDTAYFPRNAFAWFFMHMHWNDQNQDVDAIPTINNFYADISPFCSQFSYANIVDYDLLNTYLNAYYGTNVARLIQIKNIYDPTNFFHWQQSIPL